MQSAPQRLRTAFVLISAAALIYSFTAPPVAFAADPAADLSAGFATRNTAIAGDPGHGVDFKMQVTNNGPDASDGFDIVVTFPGTDYIASPSLTDPPTDSANCGPFVPGSATSSVTCHVSSLAVQTSGNPAAFAEVEGTVSPSVPAGTNLTATATATPAGAATDPNEINNSTTTTPTVVQTFADLPIEKTASTDGSGDEENPRVIAGQDAFDYTLTVTNNGPSDNVGGFVVSDTLPDGVQYASSTPIDACSADGQEITCTESDGIGADQTEDFTVHVNATADAADTGP